jgi:predicted amidohydrolase
VTIDYDKDMKIGLAQLLLEGGEPKRNYERAKKLVEKAASQGLDLVVLPEACDFAWTHPSSRTEAQRIPGKLSEAYRALASENNIHLCVGLTERLGEKVYNAALLFNDHGETLLHYRKINLLEVEFPFYEVGNHLEVVDTKFGKIGVNICSDNYPNSLAIGECLARMGAQIILSPSSWTVEHSITEEDDPYAQKWTAPLSSLCSAHNIHIVSTTSVGYIVGGPYEGKKMIGQSLVVGPSGILVKGPFNEVASELITCELTLFNNPKKGVQIKSSLLPSQS